ncbi:MAG: T9SS type A sorting domain-containing protein [Saprospiraceae bacterium]|nr:T9SS type A sorting domain-containing protein [Saprospiraceae bacterium]
MLGNTPNPWNTETGINFYLPKAGKVKLTVRDLTGRVLYTTYNEYLKGENTILVTRDQLEVGGLLLYDLTFDNEVKSMKMLNIR